MRKSLPLIIIIAFIIWIAGCLTDNTSKYEIFPGNSIVGNKMEPCFIWGHLVVRNKDTKPLDIFTLHLEIIYTNDTGSYTLLKKDFAGENLKPNEEFSPKYKVDIPCGSKLENFKIISVLKDENGEVLAECGHHCEKPFRKNA